VEIRLRRPSDRKSLTELALLGDLDIILYRKPTARGCLARNPPARRTIRAARPDDHRFAAANQASNPATVARLPLIT